MIIMPRCACAMQVRYTVVGSVSECECVCVLLVSPKLLKTKRWYREGKCKSTISRFLIGQNVKKWLCFCDVHDLLT